MKKSKKLTLSLISIAASLCLMTLGVLAAGGWLFQFSGHLARNSIKSEEDILVSASVLYKIGDSDFVIIGEKSALSDSEAYTADIDLGYDAEIIYKIETVNYGKGACLYITVSDTGTPRFSDNFTVSGSLTDNFADPVAFHPVPQDGGNGLIDIIITSPFSLEEGFDTESAAVFYMKFARTSLANAEVGYSVLLEFAQQRIVTLSFENSGGDAVEPISAPPGSPITLAEPLGQAGYEFVGWYTDEGLTERFESDVMPGEDTRLYAKWSLSEYTITYENLLSGTNPPSNPTTYTVLSDDIIFAPPTRTGYTGSWDIAGIPKGSTGNKIIQAVWNPIEYNISYTNLLGGTNPSSNPTTYTADSNTITFAPPTGRAGYTGSWDIPSIPKGSTGNKTIRAVWTVNTYTITYNYQGGTPSSPSTATVTYGSSYTLATPTKSGLVFCGWYEQANGGGKQYTSHTGKSLSNWNETAGKTLYAFFADAVAINIVIYDGSYPAWSATIITDLQEINFDQNTTIMAPANSGTVCLYLYSDDDYTYNYYNEFTVTATNGVVFSQSDGYKYTYSSRITGFTITINIVGHGPP